MFSVMLAMFREFSKLNEDEHARGLELLLPGDTRVATNYTMLRRVTKMRGSMERMVVYLSGVEGVAALQ